MSNQYANRSATSSMRLIPIQIAEVFPLWKDGGKVYRPYNWQTIDFSELDWLAKYTDYSKKKDKEFTRSAPNSYAVRGGKSLSIIDIDNKSPGLADETLAKLIALGLDTNTFTVKSKSGGYHLYYLRPSYAVKTCTGWQFPNVDIRGDDGYVVGPDTSLTEWVEGEYVITKNIPVIECELDLPARGSKPVDLSTLPVITNNLQDFSIYLDGTIIPNGKRDAMLLYVSGQWVAEGLTDEQIANRFAALQFEHIAGDTPELSDLMDKVDRDRQKSDDIMGYTLKRFVYVKLEEKIYDLYDKQLVTLTNAGAHFPATIMILGANGAPKTAPIFTEWNKDLSRISVNSVGFKPAPETIYYEGNKSYVNSFDPAKINPWHEAVSAEDEELRAYFQIISNLCSDRERVVDMYHSQIAAKVQDLLWTPRWGFIIYTEYHRIGKDMTCKIACKIMGGLQYYKPVTISDLKSDRNMHLNDCLYSVLNEPNALTNNANSGLDEAVKLLFSETEVSTRPMRCNASTLRKVYRIPRIHTNSMDFMDLHDDNTRFAPIICKRPALKLAVYQSLKTVENTSSFQSKLKRYYMDYAVHEDINDSTAPVMPDVKEFVSSSKSSTYQRVLDAIESESGFFISDIQSQDSLQKAMNHALRNTFDNTKLINKMVKDGTIQKILYGPKRANRVDQIIYSPDVITNEAAQFYKLPTENKQIIYSIRNHECYGELSWSELKKNFFNFIK